MREIKFRGKRIDNGKWVYGYFYFELEHTDNGAPEHYYREYDIPLPYITDGQHSVLVDPETVGQYTGLKDIKGKEIYEGDIVKVTIKYYTDCSKGKLDRKKVTIEIVSFDYYTFGLKEAKDDESITPLLWLISLESKLEVIGNIYENPELLKKLK